MERHSFLYRILRNHARRRIGVLQQCARFTWRERLALIL